MSNFLKHMKIDSFNPEMFKGTQSDSINLSCLLNIFDGILETPGRIIILTSNYPDKIDKALLRPGRIDTNIELKKASATIVKEILQSFYDISIEKIEELSQNKIIDYVLTPAEVMNICQNNIFDFENTIKKLT
jgi:ATP-dependent 26S proteasome regulatory subunit